MQNYTIRRQTFHMRDQFLNIIKTYIFKYICKRRPINLKIPIYVAPVIPSFLFKDLAKLFHSCFCCWERCFLVLCFILGPNAPPHGEQQKHVSAFQVDHLHITRRLSFLQYCILAQNAIAISKESTI